LELVRKRDDWILERERLDSREREVWILMRERGDWIQERERFGF